MKTQSHSSQTAKIQVRGKQYTERESYYDCYTHGFTDMQYYDPRCNEWRNLPDIFHVMAEDRQTARTEFWARWFIYRNRRWPKQQVWLTDLNA